MKRILSLLLVLSFAFGFSAFANAAEVQAETAAVTLKSIVLRPGCAGVYYTAELDPSADVAAWGVAWSVREMPDGANLEECLYTRVTDTNYANSALLTDVLKQSNSLEQNKENLVTSIYARPYVETIDGEILFGDGVEHTFQDVITAVDRQWSELSATQKDSVLMMYDTHAEVMDPEKAPTIEDAYQDLLQPDVPEDPDAPQDTPAYDTDTAPEADATEISIGILTQRAYDFYDTHALTLWLEEQTGYDIKVTAYQGTVSTGNNYLTYMIAGMYEMPDILIGFEPSASNLQTFGQDGYFVDLTKYYADADGASLSFWTTMDSNLTKQQQEAVIRKITSSDGKRYALPTVSTTATGHMKYQPWINTQWLDALGLQMPTNMSELYEVLVAFKKNDPNGNGLKDEVPLLGSSKANGAKVVDWLINMFCYYDSDNPWQPDRNGNVKPVFTSEEYRMALQFVKKLYSENLLFNGYEVMSAADMKALMASDVIGVFVGDPYLHTNTNSLNLLKYEAMPLWGYAVENDLTVKSNAILTGMCETPNAAFRVMMALYSQAGQERMRYGEYGVDWTEAEEGAVSLYGIPAEYKVINYPGSDKVWGVVACTFDRASDGSLIQQESALTPVQQHLQTQLAEMIENYRKNASWAPANAWHSSPAKTATSINTQVTRYLSDFVSGRADIYNNSVWTNYLQLLENMGLSSYTDQMQQAYSKK